MNKALYWTHLAEFGAPGQTMGPIIEVSGPLMGTCFSLGAWIGNGFVAEGKFVSAASVGIHGRTPKPNRLTPTTRRRTPRRGLEFR